MRPEIIRADSIDLQSEDVAHPAPLGSGPPAPHQAETLREVKVEALEENHRSPRVSKEWTSGEINQINQYGDDLAAGVQSKLNGVNLQQQQDTLALAQNGGNTGSTAEDADMADAEGDDGMDDDMMDKISSSPSIDDGGYPLPQPWPQRADSFTLSTPTKSPSSQACDESSSPFVETPEYYPLRLPSDPIDKDDVQGVQSNEYRHVQGELPDTTISESNYDPDRSEDLPTPASKIHRRVEAYDLDFDLDLLAEELLTANQGTSNESDNMSHVGDDAPYDDSRESEDLAEMERILESYEEGIPTIPYEATSDDEDEDDDLENFFYPYIHSRVDSGWGGDCLQDTEDIDFEFVYALHTFVATVEGQANATKGDTMVLLDDSNSYWWLVRVVKDSSIGYLPAEHIETPTERLARLNKHRNIDLTSTMLGDQAEKSKNPLKKAIRRRNAKTVTFTAPTYVEASDNDYSTDEEEGEEGYYSQNGQQEQNGEQQEQAIEEEEIAAVEPLKPRAEIREVKSESVEPETKDVVLKTSSDASRTSDEIFEAKAESKSRNGTVRNTDSFFKDDTVETRKITLTPNLLRDDSSTSTRTSNDSKELKQRPSLDKLEKDSPERNKDKKAKDKKDKEKKPGMLSGLFKRKEKKNKSSIDDEIDELMGSKNSRSSPETTRDSDDMVAVEEQAPAQAPNQTSEVQRQPSKLQKQPRTDTSPTRKTGQGREPKPSEPQQAPAPTRATPAELVPAPSMRLVQPEAADEGTQQNRNMTPEKSRDRSGSTPAPVQTTPKEQKSVGAISKMLRSNSESKPVKAKKAKSRVELDDFDSSDEHSPDEEPVRAPSKQVQRPIPGSFPDSYIMSPQNERSNPADERLSESPVQVSPVQSYPPPLMVDTSSQEEPPSPVSSPSPELIDAEDAREKKGGSSTTSTSTPTWNDTHLRTFFDDDADIKDLLVVVYDKSGVVPAGPDHPITGNLFREENAKLADITNRLDGMLGDWLARKMRTQTTR